jgi:hypothetical protein
MVMVIEADGRYIADPEFTTKITKAMKLLESKASAANTSLTNSVGRVRAAERSGTNIFAKPLTIDIAKATFDASLTWLASVLAHESVHAGQFLAKKPYSGKEAEQAANACQLSVLRQIKAPDYEITYMMSQDGGHFDLNGDGKYDWKDYALRKY